MNTTADPHCMNCKKSWNEKFLVENLNRSFCDKDYKEHRKQLLTDREIAKLPETMPLAERRRRAEVEEKKAENITAQIMALNKQIDVLRHERQEITIRVYHIKNGTDQGPNTEKKKFIMPCTNNTCRGYLSTQYKCELCDMFTCPKCMELIGYSKTEEHTCNPDSVASAELIKKETKGCPTCGVRIHKISGCNQMWCTECKVAFDYKTGAVDTGVVHNPHYYNHMRRQTVGGEAPRNPQDVLCGGLIQVPQLHRVIFSKVKMELPKGEYETMVQYLGDMHRAISHITQIDLPRTRGQVRDLGNGEELRIQYILGQIGKEEIGRTIYRQDTQRKKQTDILHIYELVSVVGIENFNTLYTQASTLDSKMFMTLVEEKIEILDNLREYCNAEFNKISVTYNRSVMFITDMWEVKSHKRMISKVNVNPKTKVKPV